MARTSSNFLALPVTKDIGRVISPARWIADRALLELSELEGDEERSDIIYDTRKCIVGVVTF